MSTIPKPNGPNVDIGPQMLGISWTLYTIAGLIVAARVYTQVKIIRQFGIGDMVMIGAMFFGINHIVFITIAHHFGWGRHFFYLNDYERVMAMKMEFISEPFGIMASTLGRVSFCCLMYRLFGTRPLRRYFLHFLICINLVVNLTTCITIFTQCVNVHSLWDPVGHPSACWSPNVQADIGFFQGAINSSIDLILTFMPSTIFFTLQMKLRIKFGLAALLGLSIFAFAASIVKTVKLKSLGERSDYTFNTVSFMNWVVVENTVVITAASIPLLRPLFNIAKEATRTAYGQTTSYELNSKGADGTLNEAKNNRSRVTTKSVGMDNSSEENILPIQRGRPSSILGGRGEDVESGVIRKEVVYQVKYDTNDGSADYGNAR